jgi:uncharacterized protein YkwD
MRRIAALLPFLVPLAATAPSAHAAGCADAGITPSGSNLARARAATLCLLNQQRRAHHLAPLRSNRALQRAATAYSREMVRERFFDHTAPDGTTFDKRIENAGYGAYSALAENIAWGSSSRSTPAQIVQSWMHSAGHRRNILDGQLRNIGIGVAPGAPLDIGGQRAATYTTDFGRRR